MILRASAGLTIHTLPLGTFMANCYVLTAPAGEDWAESDCWIIDPAERPVPLLRMLQENKLTPRRIVLTHGHGDHIGGCGQVKQAYPQSMLTAPAGDAVMLTDSTLNLSAMLGADITAPPADELVQPGQELRMGGLAWRVLDASGHTPGGCAYFCPQAEVAITGDALFAGSIGRCDLPGGDEDRLLANIHRHLLNLPESTRILPGHGPPSTIGQEKRSNPYLQSDS